MVAYIPGIVAIAVIFILMYLLYRILKSEADGKWDGWD